MAAETSLLTLLNQIGVPAIVLLLLLRELLPFIAAMRNGAVKGERSGSSAGSEVVDKVRDLWYGRREMTQTLATLAATAEKQTEILRDLAGMVKDTHEKTAKCPARQT